MQAEVAKQATTPSAELPLSSGADGSIESVVGFGQQIMYFIPKLVIAALLLLVGLLIAKLVSKAASAASDKLGLQRAAVRSGLSSAMQQVGIRRSVPEILALIIFWLLLCVFLLAACDVLGLQDVTKALERVMAYIPKVLVATVLVVIGMLLATLLRGVIATGAESAGMSFAPQLAAGCYWTLALMTLIAAFEQLEIRFELLSYAILIGFAAVALGLGLSFGLGGRDVMAGVVAGYYVRQRMQPGDRVVVGGFEGKVREVGPVATVIETDEEGLQRRRSIPNLVMLNEAIR